MKKKRGIGRCKDDGINHDGHVSPFPNTRTLMCLNQFCEFTFAEEMDEVVLRRCEVNVQCPKCGCERVKIVSYTPNPPKGRKKLPKRRKPVAKKIRCRAA